MPDIHLRYRAEIYKQRLIEDYKYELPLLEDQTRFLIQNKMIDADYESKIKNLSDAIRRLKKDLYLCGPRIEKENKTRNDLTLMKDKFYNYVGSIELLCKSSVEYFAENLKNKFLVVNTVKTDSGLVFDQDEIDIVLLTNIIDKINDQDIREAQLREIARTNPWQDYWRANKYNLFGIPAIEYSEDQKTLCSLSRMYDNVWEHPERPSDEVIDDDDKLDGFLIYQSEKQENNKQKKELTQMPSKYDEVYITAHSQAEANMIYAQNSPDAIRMLKQRSVVLKKKDEVKDLDFVDRRMDLLEQMSAAESAAIKQRS